MNTTTDLNAALIADPAVLTTIKHNLAEALAALDGLGQRDLANQTKSILGALAQRIEFADKEARAKSDIVYSYSHPSGKVITITRKYARTTRPARYGGTGTIQYKWHVAVDGVLLGQRHMGLYSFKTRTDAYSEAIDELERDEHGYRLNRLRGLNVDAEMREREIKTNSTTNGDQS